MNCKLLRKKLSKIIMCNLSERIEEKAIQKGIALGMERGMERGMKRGMEQGELTQLASLVKKGLLSLEIALQEAGEINKDKLLEMLQL